MMKHDWAKVVPSASGRTSPWSDSKVHTLRHSKQVLAPISHCSDPKELIISNVDLQGKSIIHFGGLLSKKTGILDLFSHPL